MGWDTVGPLILGAALGALAAHLSSMALARFNQQSTTAEALRTERLTAYVEAVRFLNALPITREEAKRNPGSERQRELIDEAHRISASLALVASSRVALAWEDFDKSWVGRPADMGYEDVKPMLEAHKPKIIAAMRADLGVETLSEDVLNRLT